MTFRAKPAVKRTHRPASQADHRRNLLLNIGFGFVVLIALLILAGAGFASWYGEHLEALATVNGEGISKDAFRDRARVETFRLEYDETKIRQRIQDGRLDAAAGQAQVAAITQKRSTISTDVMNALIDATLQAQLAVKQGVTVTEQQVGAAVTIEATTSETRHLWIMGIKPQVDSGATEPTDKQKADAKAKADQALVDLKGGRPWADVATSLPDDQYSSKGGEVGWVSKDTSDAIDTKLRDALFSLPANGLTDVMESSDGMFRIGQVTEIEAATVDQAFQQKLKDQGVSLDSYRKVARATALQQALNDKLVGEVADQPSTQRHVAEIFLAVDNSGGAGVGDEVKVRHILFAPNNDTSAAQTLPATDPAWKKAEDEADAAYQTLLKDPSQFAELAKTSDDTGSQSTGGELPYYTKVNLDPAFGNAVFADGLKKDQILAPVKSSFGWHVIQFIGKRKQPADRMADIKAQAEAPGADFAAIAKANSESSTADEGGDIGWVAKYQLDSAREIAIFKPPVGGITDTITVASGIYIYKVLEEQTRAPDPDQAAELKAEAFTNWYTAEKNFARIVRLFSTSQEQLPDVP